MAQVRKLQSGGRASLFYNNEKVDWTDDLIRQYENAFKDDPEMLEAALNPNETLDINHDVFANTVTGNIPKSTHKRGYKRTIQDENRRNKLAALLYDRPGKTIKGKTILNPGEDLYIEFDNEGKVSTWDPRIKNRLESLFNPEFYNNATHVEGFETSKSVDGVKKIFNEDAKKALMDYQQNPTKENFEKVKFYFNEAKIYVKDKEKTPEELEAEAKAKKEKEKAEANKKLTEKGWDANIYGDRFVVNDKGQIQLIDHDLTNALSQYTGRNLWLNEDFKNTGMKNGYDFSWIPTDKGLFRINGNWYLGNNRAMTGNDLVAFNNWVSHNKTTPGGSNEYFVQYWNTTNPYERDIQDDDMYSYAINPGNYYIDRSGMYVRGDNTPLVYDIFDQSLIGGDIYDDLGHIKNEYLKRVYVDPDSGKILSDYDPNNLQLETNMDAVNNYYSDNNENRKTAFRQYMTANDGTIKYRPVSAFSNNNTGYGLFYTPKSNNYYWHSQNFLGDDAPLNYAFKDVSNSGIIVDPRVAQWIQNNSDLIKMDPQLAYEIDKIVRMPWLTPGNWRDEPNLDTSIFYKYPTLAELVRNLESTPYMMGKEEWNYHHNPKDSGLSNVANENGYIIRFDKKKNGGILKHQFGGVTWNPSTKATEGKKEKIAAPARGAGEAKVIGDGTDLNATDKIELAALIADAASLGISFVPGANIAAAGVGAASSVADLVYNIRKDGFDIEEVGRFAVNLGLDAGTLLPGIGGVSKAAKLAKAMKSSKVLGKVIKGLSIGASSVSVGNIALSWEKLQDGKWTVDDLRTILNGVRGITNLSKVAGSATKKGVSSEKVTLTQDGKNPVTITKKQFDKIQDMPKNQQKSELAKIIRDQNPSQKPVSQEELRELAKKEVESKDGYDKMDSDQVNKEIDDLIKKMEVESKVKSDEELLDSYNIGFNKSKDKFSWKKPSSWMFWRNGAVKGLEFPVGDRVYRDPTAMSWYNFNRRAAIRDARVNPNNPYFNKLAALEGRANIMMSNGEMSFPMIRTWNAPSIPSPVFRRAKITPIVQANLYPTWRDREVKPQSNAFMREGGKIKKASSGMQFLKNLENGTQSVLPMLRGANLVSNIKYINKVADLNNKAIEARRNIQFNTPILRTESVSSYISGIDRQNSANKQAMSNLRLSTPKTSDWNSNFMMNNTIANHEYNYNVDLAAKLSNGINEYNRISSNIYNTQAQMNAEAANKRSQNESIVNMLGYQNEANRNMQIGSELAGFFTEAKQDQAMQDKFRRNAYIASEDARLQSVMNNELAEMYEEAEAEWMQYKNSLPEGQQADNFEEWLGKQGRYQNKISEIQARYRNQSIINNTQTPNWFTGGMYAGFNPGIEGFAGYNTYLDDERRYAGSSKKGGKLSVSERKELENNKHTNDMEKQRIKNLIKSLEMNNKRIYELLLKL